MKNDLIKVVSGGPLSAAITAARLENGEDPDDDLPVVEPPKKKVRGGKAPPLTPAQHLRRQLESQTRALEAQTATLLRIEKLLEKIAGKL